MEVKDSESIVMTATLQNQDIEQCQKCLSYENCARQASILQPGLILDNASFGYRGLRGNPNRDTFPEWPVKT